jgi:hypothetical protein
MHGETRENALFYFPHFIILQHGGLKAKLRENTMTTPIQQKIRDKKRTARHIADMVKSGDWVNRGTTGGDSTVCTKVVAR